MKCQINILYNFIICLLCLHMVSSDAPKAKQQPMPLVFKNWPPNRNSASIRGSQLMLALRGAGSSNIVSRVPSPGMFIKSGSPIRFAMQSRPGSLASSSSSNVIYKAGPPQSQGYKRPYHPSHQSSVHPGMFKFSSPAHKTAIKFQSAPPVPLKYKPEFVYEKVNVPKYPDPVRFNIGSDSVIHTIPAPNLGNGASAPEFNLNNQLDSDLTMFSAHGFSINKPATQYQVKENINDITYKNTLTGQNVYFAPDSDPSLKTQSVRPIEDPLSFPSDGRPKPADILYHQSLDFGAQPLIQGPQYSIEPYGFSVTSQPQLQQYHLQQNNMMKQGMPLASLNPTYLVMQSNNLFGQHQQHLTSQLFRPENGYIDTSVTAQPGPAIVTFNGFDYSKPQQVASLGQIYSAQQDQLQQVVESTQPPTTHETFSHDGAASQKTPSFTQLPDPKPSHYQYSHQNFIDLPDEHLTQNDISNLLNYNDMYLYRQIENDQILKEAQENLQQKLKIQHQQDQTAYDLHQLVQQEKYHPLRIVVPDDDQGFKKRVDDEAISYEDDESEIEDDQNESENETSESETNLKEALKGGKSP